VQNGRAQNVRRESRTATQRDPTWQDPFSTFHNKSTRRIHSPFTRGNSNSRGAFFAQRKLNNISYSGIFPSDRLPDAALGRYGSLATPTGATFKVTATPKKPDLLKNCTCERRRRENGDSKQRWARATYPHGYKPRHVWSKQTIILTDRVRSRQETDVLHLRVWRAGDVSPSSFGTLRKSSWLHQRRASVWSKSIEPRLRWRWAESSESSSRGGHLTHGHFDELKTRTRSTWRGDDRQNLGVKTTRDGLRRVVTDKTFTGSAPTLGYEPESCVLSSSS